MSVDIEWNVFGQLLNRVLHRRLSRHQELEILNQVGFISTFLAINLVPAVGVVFDPRSNQLQISARLLVFRVHFQGVSIRGHGLLELIEDLLTIFWSDAFWILSSDAAGILRGQSAEIKMGSRRDCFVRTESRFQISFTSLFFVAFAMQSTRFVECCDGSL